MFHRRQLLRLLLACASAPACFAGATTTPDPTAKPAGGGEVQLETERLEVSADGRTVIALPDAHGNPVLVTSGARLEAGRIVYDKRDRSASAESGVKVDFGGLRLLSDTVEYKSALRRLDTGRVRFGRPPAYAEAEKISIVTAGKQKVDTSSATLDRVKVYFNEPDGGVISVSASTVRFSSDTGIMRAEDVVFRIGPVPILYLPSYEQEGLQAPPLDPEIQAGASQRTGAFLRTTTFVTVNPRWQPGLLFDAYGRAGVLAGPALRYDTAKVPAGDPVPYNLMKGDIRAGFLGDHAELGTDAFGHPIPEDRWFVEWNHKQTLGDGLEVTNSLHWWSDPFATRDLRPRLFEGRQSPDNFVEVVYPDRDYYASVFLRHDPNGFEDVNSRLPEIRLDLNPREISDWRLYQRGHASFVYLREETSRELASLPGTTGAVLDTPRFDAYYGLTRPITPSTAFALTPVAGVRSTTWFDSQGAGSATTERFAGQVGFDAHALATGAWDYDNTVWEINGLRHRLRPVVQYRYLPGVTQGAGRIPQIDRWAFLTAPPPIDLEQRRDTDEMHETQILRVGLENLFQTRHVEYGSRDLIAYNVYQDFRDTDRPGDRLLSDTYSQATLTPAEWLDFEVYNRVSPYSGRIHETTTALGFHDGDRWRFTVGTQKVTDVASLDQCYATWEYKVNSLYTALARWRYDAPTGTLTEQEYGLRQQLGHSWRVEYVIGHRRNAREDSGIHVGVHLRLVSF